MNKKPHPVVMVIHGPEIFDHGHAAWLHDRGQKFQGRGSP
jgi:hypothetical protein